MLARLAARTAKPRPEPGSGAALMLMRCLACEKAQFGIVLPAKRPGQGRKAAEPVGMPAFVDLGIDEPPSDWFTLVIWAEALDADLERMLNAVDHGDAWLKVSGYVYLHGSHPQAQTGHGCIE